jgi:hypothetical protein
MLIETRKLALAFANREVPLGLAATPDTCGTAIEPPICENCCNYSPLCGVVTRV